MTLLADVERLLERVFERTSARVFRTPLRPVQLERRIERAMEMRRTGAQRTVPDRFRLRLNPTDLAAVGEERGLDVLAGSLADAALGFARAHSYHLLARPSVTLAADDSVPLGQLEVETSFTDQSANSRPRPAAAVVDSSASSGVASSRDASPVTLDDEEPDPNQTRVFRPPSVGGPRAVLREVRPDGTDRTIEVDGGILSIGRSGDNALVLVDSRVSRHHGRLQTRRGALVYTDLGSTNGTRVNGLGVDEIALGPGDRIEIGDTVLVVETLPG
ncbi:MAG: FhaA domain-containing protein [Chloroflexota bacterium]